MNQIHGISEGKYFLKNREIDLFEITRFFGLDFIEPEK